MKRILRVFLLFLLILIVAFPLLCNVKITPIHADESYWLQISKYFKLLLLDGRPLKEVLGLYDYQYRSNIVYLTFYDQPSLGKYMYVATSYLAGHKIEDVNLLRLIFQKDKQYHIRQTVTPSRRLLLPYRYVSAYFGLLSCVFVFLIGEKLSNHYTGIIAAIYIAYNPLMIICSTRAMADGFLIFFICLSVYLMGLFLASLNKGVARQALLSSVLVGVTASLATSVKLNGVITSILFITLCLFILALRALSLLREKAFSTDSFFKDRYIRVVILSILVFSITTFALFIIINPYLLDNPVPKIRHMILSRLAVMKFQDKVFDAGLHSIRERVTYIWRVIFSPHPIYFILFLMGVFLMLKDEVTYIIKNGFCSYRTIILLWFFLSLAVLLRLLLLSWDRYLLPLLPAVVLLTAYTIGRLVRPSISLGTNPERSRRVRPHLLFR